MKTTAFAIALLMSGAAVAQTTSTATTETDRAVQTDTSMPMTTAYTAAPASGAMVQPGNTNPERDARGIAVMSDPAMVPAGWNGVTGTAVGGPFVDASTGASASGSDTTYPACSAAVTDNCLQTYERGRSPR